MAESYRFFDAVGSDRQYTSADFAAVLARFLKNGYIPGVGGELAITATDPASMMVSEATGEAMVWGRWYGNDTAKTLNITAADPSNPRIDRIVLKLDLDPATRSVSVVVKTGTPAASPLVPELIRTTTVWEIPLARVVVDAGVGTITADKIVDERNSSECGMAIPPYLETFLATIFNSHKVRHARNGDDALSLDDIAPAGMTRGDILYQGAAGLTRLAAGTAGQVLKTGGPGANPGWADETGGGTGSGGTSVNCQGTNLGDGDWVTLARFVVPALTTFTLIEAGVYPSGISDLVLEVYNETDGVSVYTTNSSFVQGASLCTIASGKEVIIRVKNSGSERTGCLGIAKFIVA